MTTVNNEDPADPSVHEPLISLEDIRGAVARGWCHPANVDKVMDLPLALAIANEVHAALYAAQQPAPQSAEDHARDKAYMAAMPMPELAPRMAQTTEGRYHDFTLAEAMEIAKRNDPGDRVPSTSRTFIAEIVRLRKALLYTADQMREAIAAERERQTKPPKWWTCQTHGDAQPNAWGCPECVREMRAELDAHAALIAEVFTIAQLGVLPDGDIVDTPTLLWAEEWARRLAEKEQPN